MPGLQKRKREVQLQPQPSPSPLGVAGRAGSGKSAKVTNGGKKTSRIGSGSGGKASSSRITLDNDEVGEEDDDMDGGFEDLENGDGSDDDDGSEGFEDLEGSDLDGSDHFDDDEGISSTSKAAVKSRSTAAEKRRAREALYAPPTIEEMQALRETGEAYRSNAIKLQIDEMLKTVRPRTHKVKALEEVLKRLHAFMAKLPSIPQQVLPDALKTLKKAYPGAKVAVPFCEPAPKTDANYKFGFEKPEGLQLVGSWPLQAATSRPGGVNVDVAVVMPSSLFQEKDHLNMRYFHKKAFYLATLAAALSKASAELGVDVEFESPASDSRRTLLVLRPVKNKAATDFSRLHACIRIHLIHQSDLFPVGRLAPSRNNIRSNASDDSSTSAASQPPTPRYNASILADSLVSAHLVYLHATAKACPAFIDACHLLKVWAFQRGFGTSSSSSSSARHLVSGSEDARFVLTMMLAHLLHGEERIPGRASTQTAKLANGFNSFQLFRGVLDWLARHDFKANPVFMKADPANGVQSRSDKIPREEFASHFDRVVVDPTGSVNLLSHWPAGAVDLLQQEARLTFSMLADDESDHFDEIFMTPRSEPLVIFDECVKVQFPSDHKSLSLATLDHGSYFPAAVAALQRTVSQAMKTRATMATVVTVESPSSRSISTYAREGLASLEIGLRYNAALALRLVEHGPAPEEKAAAAAFQDFWGEVAELRRFKDGRILYSIVWETVQQSERWSIPGRIIQHVLQRHFAIGHDQIELEGEAFAPLLRQPADVTRKAYLASPEEKGFQLVQAAFDNLATQLRSLEGLPLALSSVTASSSGLRGTSTFIPGPLNLSALGSGMIPTSATYLPAHDINLTFESSGKWPDDLKAIQAMKLAFFERLATLLPSVIPDVQAQVAFDVDTSESAIQDCASLELILPSGFAFRARIHHERERVLLERIIADERDETPAFRRAASRALARFNRRFVFGPQHHAAIATLQHRFVGFAETIRLLKRWLSSQMLLGAHISSEVVELLACSVYVSPGAAVPCSGAAGFLQVVQKLATWKWREEPLLLPLGAAVASSEDSGSTGPSNIRIPAEIRKTATEAFRILRSSDPSLSRRAYFIATESDPTSLRWTDDEGPSGSTAHAIQGLAKGAMKLLSNAAAGAASPESPKQTEVVKALFTPSMKSFDFVIHLDQAVNTMSSRHLSLVVDDSSQGPSTSSSSFVNALPSRSTSASSSKTKTSLSTLPRIDFNPASAYVDLLRSLYGDSLRLFHDAEGGGGVVGGMWNPSLASTARKWRVGAGFNAQPVEDSEGKGERKGLVRLNWKGIVAEMERLAEGIVQKSEVVRDPTGVQASM